MVNTVGVRDIQYGVVSSMRGDGSVEERVFMSGLINIMIEEIRR
jgi:hypothetical protein